MAVESLPTTEFPVYCQSAANTAPEQSSAISTNPTAASGRFMAPPLGVGRIYVYMGERVNRRRGVGFALTSARGRGASSKVDSEGVTLRRYIILERGVLLVK